MSEFTVPLPAAVLPVSRLAGRPLSYNQLYNLALSGVIPTERVGRRMFVRERDFAAIAEVASIQARPGVGARQTPPAEFADLPQAA